MAMFTGYTGPLQDTKDQKFRTNTKLQAGTHDSPGEKFVIDPRLARIFRYHFGGDGWVKIPKGRIVAPARNGGPKDDGRFLDMDTGAGYLKPAITLANGGKDITELDINGDAYVRAANIPIGVAASNFYEEFLDGFNRMQPTMENEIYIELPYIPTKEDALEIGWGAAYDVDPNSPLENGDYVMSDDQGYFIKADFKGLQADIANAADLDALKVLLAEQARMQEQVIGQVWVVERELTPQGWLKWVGWSAEQTQDDNKPSGRRSEETGVATGDEFPGFPFEKTYRNWDMKQQKYFPQGIPGLTNGANIQVPFTDKKLGTINPGTALAKYDFFIEHTPFVHGTLELKIDGVVVTPEYADAASGRVLVSYDATANTKPVDVTASYLATGQIPGVPTNRDFKGSVGAVRILLHK